MQHWHHDDGQNVFLYVTSHLGEEVKRHGEFLNCGIKFLRMERRGRRWGAYSDRYQRYRERQRQAENERRDELERLRRFYDYMMQRYPQIERELARGEEMKEYFDHYEAVEPLEPRDAFFGGRTNAAKLYCQCEEDEKIK